VVISGTRLAANTINYVLGDVQGSTRAVMSGTSVVARHDFLPFGEEIAVTVGMRTSGQGFRTLNSMGLPVDAQGAIADKIRQRYGLTERDDASGLDHTWWRKNEIRAGRWTSPDPYLGSMIITNPQSFNRYAYVNNDPVNFVDPTGLCTFNIDITNGAGISTSQLGTMQGEIQRIFGVAGQGVVFNNAGAANGGSFNLTIQQAANPRHVARGIVAPGWTDLNTAGTAVTRNGFASTQVLASSIQTGLASNPSLQTMGRHPSNLAIGLGRVGAHEAGHFLLQMLGHSSEGLMRARFGGAQWFSQASNNDFRFTLQQMAQLFRLCPPQLSTPTNLPQNSITPRPPIGGGGRGGGGGGDIRPPNFGGGGFGGWTSFDFLYLSLGRGGGGGSVSVSFNGRLTVL